MPVRSGVAEHRRQAIDRRLGNHPVEAPQLGLELLVGRALLAQRLEHEAAELPPRRGELVGDVDDREIEAPRQLRVGRTRGLVAGEVVLLEQR